MLFLGVVGVIFVLFIGILLMMVSSFEDTQELSLDFSSDKVALVTVDGVIDESRHVIDQLRKYAKDSSVRAIVLRIDSPGGGVAASQEIHEEVRRIRDSKTKSIVVSMGTVAASGGYYIACSANKIVANPGTITGSIGVIAQWTNYGELFHWAKLKDITFKSGPFKDSGSPVRELSEDERAYFQQLVSELYEQFVQSVADGRKMQVEDVRKLADGRVYTGAQAKKMGLIDQIGNLQDAIRLAADLGGIRGEPRIVEPTKERLTLIDLLFGGLSRYLPVSKAPRAPFEYRWSQEAPSYLEK